MALDKDGRPIPIGFTEQPDHSGQPTEDQKQFVIMAEKADAALRFATDVSQRMAAFEQVIQEQLNTKLGEYESRFNTLMVERLGEFQKQIDAMASRYPTMDANAHLAPAKIDEHSH